MSLVRRARSTDASLLSRLAEETFRAAFGEVNGPETMDLHCRQNFGAAIQSREIADPDVRYLLSEEDGQLVGFAQLRWGRAPDCVDGEAPSELHRLYVVDAWHGQGIAQALMDACIQEARLRGSDVIWLGVWERNPRAIAFYRKCGFVEAGNQVFLLGDDPQRDIVMVRSLSAEDG